MSENEEDNKMSEKPEYGVPENYFEKSAASILAHLERFEENKIYPQLSKHRNLQVFKIPSSYFQNSEAQVKLILGDETVLKGFNKENSFSVPNDYFLKSENKITGLLIPKSAKIILLWTRPLKYAAAVLIVAIGWWLYNFNITPNELVDCKTIACVDKKEILQGKSIDNLEEEDLYELVDSDELEQSLDMNSIEEGLDSSDSFGSPDELLDNI